MCEWIFAGVSPPGALPAPKGEWCFPTGRAISAEGGVAVHRGADHVELPRLACPKGCFDTSISMPDFPAKTTLFSPDLRSLRLVSPIRLSVLGRTYGTYLHYERSYSINVFFIRNIGESRLRFDLRAKTSDSREISPQFPGKFHRNR